MIIYTKRNRHYTLYNNNKLIFLIIHPYRNSPPKGAPTGSQQEAHGVGKPEVNRKSAIRKRDKRALENAAT
jgi:hypothetical protein